MGLVQGNQFQQQSTVCCMPVTEYDLLSSVTSNTNEVSGEGIMSA